MCIHTCIHKHTRTLSEKLGSPKGLKSILYTLLLMHFARSYKHVYLQWSPEENIRKGSLNQKMVEITHVTVITLDLYLKIHFQRPS